MIKLNLTSFFKTSVASCFVLLLLDNVATGPQNDNEYYYIVHA